MVSEELIRKAEEFHGHVCPFLVLGLRMAEIAMRRLGVARAGALETVREDLVAIVEVNNCLADGVQVATGCTLGNNSLIYLDLGKNAVTLFRRGERRGVRVYVDAERVRSRYFPEEALKLFQRVVVERVGSDEDVERLRRVWREVGYAMANVPEEEFVIQEVEVVEEVGRAPIIGSVRCSACGELFMESKALRVGGATLCRACASVEVQAVVGRGIGVLRAVPYRVVKAQE